MFTCSNSEPTDAIVHNKETSIESPYCHIHGQGHKTGDDQNTVALLNPLPLHIKQDLTSIAVTSQTTPFEGPFLPLDPSMDVTTVPAPMGDINCNGIPSDNGRRFILWHGAQISNGPRGIHESV